MRGCLIVFAGFILGAGLMVYLWPHIPSVQVLTGGADVRITISDSYLSRQVTAHVASIAVPHISNVEVVSVPPASLVTRVHLGVGPIEVPASIQVHPVVTGGEVAVQVTAVQVGDVPIPPQLAGALQESINASARHLLDANLRISGVAVIPTVLVIDANNG